MFCPNCGTQIPEGCTFCPSCGTKVGEPVQTVSQPKPKRRLTKLIPVAIVLVVAIAAVTLFRTVMGGVKGTIVYFGDGDYYMMKGLDKDPIEFDSLREGDAEDLYYALVKFSSDGKYVYYFSKLDSYYSTGTLCRAPVGKVHKGNDDAGETIDTDVQVYGWDLLENNDVVYLDGDNNLKYYHDGEAQRIARDVQYHYLLEDETGLVYMTSGEESQDLYGVEFSAPDNAIKLAGDVDGLEGGVITKDSIPCYTYDDETGVQTLYVTDFAGNMQKLADDIQYVGMSGEKNELYYLAPNGSKLNLYNYVDDPLAAQDASATEPSYDNYQVPYYTYWYLNIGDDPNAYSELYTSCTQSLSLLDNGWDSMEDVVNNAFGDYSQATKDAVQAFINKYESTQDDDGFLLVTDEVRNDLKSISATMEGAEDGDWIALCCRKEQRGTTTDYTAYSEALDAYREAQNRNNLRKTLQSAEQEMNVQALHTYNTEEKTDTVILDNIVTTESAGDNLVAYRTVDQITNKISIDEVSSTVDVMASIMDLSTGSVPVLDTETGKTVVTLNGEDYSEATIMYLCGNTVVMSNTDEEILTAPISNGTAGSFSLLAQEAQVHVNTENNGLYYYANTYSGSDGGRYGDYYCYADGTSTLLVRDTMVYGTTVYKDGTILLAESNDEDTIDYTLMNKKGESDFLADNVSQLYYFSKNKILYISDGDLYSYNGKERTRLAQDVEHMWCNAETQEVVNGYFS